MDRHRASLIAHGDLPFWNPIDPDLLDRRLDDLDLPPGARVLDVGCGPAELLARLVARHDVRATGVDPSGPALERGRARLAEVPGGDAVQLVEGALDPEAWPAAGLELIACLGASHALGGLDGLLTFAAERLAPGGLLLVGEGHWAREPSDAYLAGLGGTRDDLRDAAGTAARFADAGLELRATHLATAAEWDRYEDTYRANTLAFLAAHPDDPDAAELRGRSDAWRALYEGEGRSTLGFGLYLAARPAAATPG